jgi:hypothetical protein
MLLPLSPDSNSNVGPELLLERQQRSDVVAEKGVLAALPGADPLPGPRPGKRSPPIACEHEQAGHKHDQIR